MREIGTVISSEEGPSSSGFLFVINQTDEKLPIRKGQFIQLETAEGLLIARVSEVFKTNRYFEKAESVKEFERSGKQMSEIFPAERWEYLVAEAFPLGVYENGLQKRTSFPPSPGQKVFPVDENIISTFFGFDSNGIGIGNVEFHGVDAKLNMTRLFQKHLAILAISGAGKSYLSSVLIEELLDRNNFKPALILFDPHGEYIGFAKDEKYMTRTKIFNKKNISIAGHHLSAFNISELVPQMSSVQRRELAPIIRKIRENKSAYSLEDLIEEIEKSEINPKTKGALVSWLSDLNSTNLFSKSDSPSLNEISLAGQLAIFDLSDFVHLKERQVILTYFGRMLFEARRQEKISPFVMFVEEAHQFAPGGEEEEQALSKYLIEQIAREGRKFNSCLVLISQRPKRLSTTALSQCNTHIILRITNPIDLQHIQESSEGISSDVADMIPGLKVGEALVVGEAVNYPILVNVRKRRSEKSEKGMKLEEALLKYQNLKKIEEEDLKAFF